MDNLLILKVYTQIGYTSGPRWKTLNLPSTNTIDTEESSYYQTAKDSISEPVGYWDTIHFSGEVEATHKNKFRIEKKKKTDNKCGLFVSHSHPVFFFLFFFEMGFC